MRIALLANYPADPSWIYGGVQAVAFHLVQGLKRHEDIELHVLHCHSDVTQDRTVRDGRAVVHYISRPKRRVIPNLITGIAPVVGVLKSIHADLANAHTGQYAVAALRAGVPTVYTIHGVARRELGYASGWRHALELAVTAFYDWSAVRRVHDVIAISSFIEREYRARTKARLHRADNPVGDEFFLSSGPSVPGRILFVGTIGLHKRPLLLLEALRKLLVAAPAAHLHLAGRPRTDNDLRRLQSYVAESGLQDRVSFLGRLDVPAIRREYADCAVLVLPSRVETAPVAILEAMAAARPVVATRVGGVPELVEDQVTGFLVAPDDVESLADRILRLVRDDSLRDSMGHRGREVARRRFQRDLVAARYRDLYREVLGRREAGRSLPHP